MKRFEFSLQGVLNAKTQLEDAARDDLARLQAQKARIEMVVDRLSALRQQKGCRLQKRVDAGTPASDAIAFQRHLALLTEQIANKRREAVDVQREIETQREKVMELTKERKSFERLRERRMTEHKRRALRQQYIAVDDMILSRRKDSDHG